MEINFIIEHSSVGGFVTINTNKTKSLIILDQGHGIKVLGGSRSVTPT